jgi:hypothetical protein
VPPSRRKTYRHCCTDGQNPARYPLTRLTRSRTRRKRRAAAFAWFSARHIPIAGQANREGRLAAPQARQRVVPRTKPAVDLGEINLSEHATPRRRPPVGHAWIAQRRVVRISSAWHSSRPQAPWLLPGLRAASAIRRCPGPSHFPLFSFPRPAM